MGYKDPEKQRQFLREWYQNVMKQRRLAWEAANTCVDCGSKENLELDHVDPSLKISHNIWSWSEKRRNEELAKCVARCHECHKKRTIAQQSKPSNHGARSFYMKYGCRCDLCVAAAALVRNEQRYRTGKRKPRNRTASIDGDASGLYPE